MIPLDTRHCLSFHHLYVTLRLSLDEALGQFHGIDFDDFALLHSLAGTVDGPIRLAAFATGLGVSRSMMLRRLRPLEKIGLLALHGGVTGRGVALHPAGLSLVHRAQETIAYACTKTQAARAIINVVASVEAGRKPGE